MSTYPNDGQPLHGDLQPLHDDLLLKQGVRTRLESPPSPIPDASDTALRAALGLIPHAQDIADRSAGWTCEHDTEYTGLVTAGDLRTSSRLCVEFVLSQVADIPVGDALDRAPEAIGERRASQCAPLEAVLPTLRRAITECCGRR
jgi:hypothetical protein